MAKSMGPADLMKLHRPRSIALIQVCLSTDETKQSTRIAGNTGPRKPRGPRYRPSVRGATWSRWGATRTHGESSWRRRRRIRRASAALAFDRELYHIEKQIKAEIVEHAPEGQAE